MSTTDLLQQIEAAVVGETDTESSVSELLLQLNESVGGTDENHCLWNALSPVLRRNDQFCSQLLAALDKQDLTASPAISISSSGELDDSRGGSPGPIMIVPMLMQNLSVYQVCQQITPESQPKKAVEKLTKLIFPPGLRSGSGIFAPVNGLPPELRKSALFKLADHCKYLSIRHLSLALLARTGDDEAQNFVIDYLKDMPEHEFMFFLREALHQVASCDGAGEDSAYYKFQAALLEQRINALGGDLKHKIERLDQGTELSSDDLAKWNKIAPEIGRLRQALENVKATLIDLDSTPQQPASAKVIPASFWAVQTHTNLGQRGTSNDSGCTIS